MFGSPGSVFSDLDDPIIPLSGPYSTIPDQPPPVSPYAQQSIHQPTGSLTEGVVFGNDSSLLILGGPHPGLGAPHTLTSASTPNPPAPLPDVYLGEQPSSIPAGSPSSHDQVEGGVGFDLSVLNLGVDAGDSVNEPTYSVPSTGHNDTLIHVGMPTDLVGINYDDTYNNFAQISAGAFGPGEQELVSAFLNLLPDGNDEPHHLHLMPNT
ncbi:uncharacterized protein EI90DRAFT_2060005 [Cantharellus anzutake]|uniref:uncharacterized protein n=1 Tax=Cantharellus anzutake TaxID=1750568 RepID=UPI001908C35A|nr:uncharacterized protein EI90DRAFT_2060005 [Cantharellus anzutake]KAF8340398.1 hypothetical protein EI90DRAFT_2060005 [Cantharellus anzutake]